MDVLNQLARKTVRINQVGLESAVKQMPNPVMPAMEPDAVRGLEPTKSFAEIGTQGLHEQVIVIRH